MLNRNDPSPRAEAVDCFRAGCNGDLIAPHHRAQRITRNSGTLTARKPGIEKLIASLPFEPADRNDLRGWTLALTASASAWEVRQAKSGHATRSRTAIGKIDAEVMLGQAMAKLAKAGDL